MRDFVSDFNSVESNSESNSVERNSDSNSNSNYGNSNSIPIQILAIPIQFQYRSGWEKPIQFQVQFRNWNWQENPIPDRNWPQLWSLYNYSHKLDSSIPRVITSLQLSVLWLTVSLSQPIFKPLLLYYYYSDN